MLSCAVPYLLNSPPPPTVIDEDDKPSCSLSLQLCAHVIPVYTARRYFFSFRVLRKSVAAGSGRGAQYRSGSAESAEAAALAAGSCPRAPVARAQMLAARRQRRTTGEWGRRHPLRLTFVRVCKHSVLLLLLLLLLLHHATTDTRNERVHDDKYL